MPSVPIYRKDYYRRKIRLGYEPPNDSSLTFRTDKPLLPHSRLSSFCITPGLGGEADIPEDLHIPQGKEIGRDKEGL